MNSKPAYPYVSKWIGCGHGKLFTEQCRECEIASLRDEYKSAIKTVIRIRDRLRMLGAPLPGEVRT